jgi:hypothetical protein
MHLETLHLATEGPRRAGHAQLSAPATSSVTRALLRATRTAAPCLTLTANRGTAWPFHASPLSSNPGSETSAIKEKLKLYQAVFDTH